MSLADAFQAAATAVFAAMTGVRKTGTYNVAGTAGYNAETGLQTFTGGAAVPLENVILSDYRAEEVDGEKILDQDRRALVLAREIPVQPGRADTLTVGGTTYQIIHWQRDPAEAVWAFQIRP